jgi:hypothetical protein
MLYAYQNSWEMRGRPPFDETLRIAGQRYEASWKRYHALAMVVDVD